MRCCQWELGELPRGRRTYAHCEFVLEKLYTFFEMFTSQMRIWMLGYWITGSLLVLSGDKFTFTSYSPFGTIVISCLTYKPTSQ
jgi:hypothetical protein